MDQDKFLVQQKEYFMKQNEVFKIKRRAKGRKKIQRLKNL